MRAPDTEQSRPQRTQPREHRRVTLGAAQWEITRRDDNRELQTGQMIRDLKPPVKEEALTPRLG